MLPHEPTVIEVAAMADLALCMARLSDVPELRDTNEQRQIKAALPKLARRIMAAANQALRAIPDHTARRVPPPTVVPDTFGAPTTLRAARKNWEKEFLCAALARAKGNATKMAAAVGLDRSAAIRKLAGLGIQYRDFRPVRAPKNQSFAKDS
jgi:transcriptional regulator of acetoin/glycerol metabolism